MKVIKKVLFLVVLFLLVVGAVFLIKKKKKELNKAPVFKEKPLIVHTVVPRKGNLEITKSYIGSVETDVVSTLAAQLTAEIKDIRYREGAKVKKGELLIQLDDQKWRDDIKIYHAQLDEVKAKLETAKIDIKINQHQVAFWRTKNNRDQILVKAKSLSKERGENTENAFKVALGKLSAAKNRIAELNSTAATIKQQLSVAKTMLGYTKLYAPYSGVITKRFCEPGDLATPGKPILALENLNGAKVCVDIIQSDLHDMSLGQDVTIYSKNNSINAPISRIYPALNEHRMLTIEIALPKSAITKFKSGEYVNLTIKQRELKNVILLPVSVLIGSRDEKTDVIFLVKNGALKKRKITILDRSRTHFATNDVSENEQVIDMPFLSWINLTAKQKVEVAK